MPATATAGAVLHPLGLPVTIGYSLGYGSG